MNGEYMDLEEAEAALAAREQMDRAAPPLNGHAASDPVGSVPKNKAPRFHLISFEQLQPSPDLAYLIKGIFPRVGLVVVWGPPKCGKSFWTTDALLHNALGWSYRGRKVVQGAVVYCALEGQDGYGKRAQAFRATHLSDNSDPVPFYLIATRMSLVKDHAELIAAVRLHLGAVNPVAIVLDTLNRSLDGSESDDKDMSAYIRAGDAVREAFNCAVIIVHHCGVEGTRPRGHTSLTGAVDAQIAVRRDAAGNVVATVEWMKDGPEGDTIVSRLEPVDVGTDQDGDKITSCVVVPADASEVRAATNRKLSDRQRLALDALAERADRGKPPPPSFGLPDGLIAVSVDDWRAELYSRGVLDRDAKSPREDFRRVKSSLQARGLIGERDGLVWRAHV
jgi:hypothetical protein